MQKKNKHDTSKKNLGSFANENHFEQNGAIIFILISTFYADLENILWIW